MKLLFDNIVLDQKEQVEAIRSISGNTIYTYTFTTLFSWKNIELYEICLSDEAYLVRNGKRGNNAYLFPCGTESGKKQLLDALLECEKPVFYFVSDEDKEFLEKSFPGRFVFSECRDDFPYLYDKDDQIALIGKNYRKLRNRINKGRNMAETWSTEALTYANIHRALFINRMWAEKRGKDGVADMDAVESALDHFTELDMWGLLFQADGADVAYVAGSFITNEIYDVNFCKVLDRDCDCYIKWLLYSALPSDVKTVDSEEDMGLEGLRTHKLLRVPKELTTVWKGSMN